MSSRHRKSISVSFRDFWPGFDEDRWFLTRILRTVAEINIVDHGNLLFFGPFGRTHTSFQGVKVYCSAESAPWPNLLDYSISWDRHTGDRHHRLPFFLWTLLDNPDDLGSIPGADIDEWASRPNFCNFVYSNWNPRLRREFFAALSKRRFVHAAGDVCNNVARIPISAADDEWRSAKLDYLRSFRFTIAFENRAIPGYTTEKPMDPIIAGSIPIYWGNVAVGDDIERSRLIVADDFGSLDELADYVCQVDEDRQRAAALLQRPALSADAVDRAEAGLVEFLGRVVDDVGRSLPRHLRGYRGSLELTARNLRSDAVVKGATLTRAALGVSCSTYLRASIVSGASEGDAQRGQPDDVVVLSAANEKYFEALLTLIASVHRFDHRSMPTVRCLDLGLKPRQRAVLERLAGVEVLDISRDDLHEHPHLGETRTFAWKIWLLREQLATAAQALLYLDAGICLVADPSPAFEVIRNDGVLLVDDRSQTNDRWTHQMARAVMHCSADDLAANQLCSGILGLSPVPHVIEFIDEAWRFVSNPECIRGSDSEHRHDQSILSILASRRGLPRQPLERFGEWRGILHDDQVVYVHRRGYFNQSGLRWARPTLPQRTAGRLWQAVSGG